MKNSYKFLFFITAMMGTLIAISSASWFSMWMGLEINLLSFIPLMMSQKNLFSSESSLKYFLIQSLASMIFLLAVILYYFFLAFKMNLTNPFSIIMISTMGIKSGTAPFHFWFPSVMEGLNWPTNMMLMTWQKIAPLMILSYCLNLYMMIFFILMSLFWGSLGGLNQSSLRKLMAFSSINHLGWMMAGMIYSESLWTLYFLFYVFLSLTVIFIFNSFNLMNLNQTFSIFFTDQVKKMFLFIPLLSMGGLPPFLGFFPKWMIIEKLINSHMFLLLSFMLFFTLVTLYFYIRISYSALLMNHTEMKWNFKMTCNSQKSNLNFFLFFLSLFGFLLINLIYFMN